MNGYSKYYLVEGGAIKDAAEKYRKDRIESIKAIHEYATSLGAIAVSMGPNHKIAGFVFNTGKSPSDFTKPRKHGLCRPKNKKKYAEFFSFETPWVHKYLNGIIDAPSTITWRDRNSDGAWGSTVIGNFLETVGLYWYSKDSPILLTVPDAKKTSLEIIHDHPEIEITFDDDVDKWEVGVEGVREILKEEYDLMKAKYKASQK